MQAEERVLQFIQQHNRPWNALGVSDHLAQFGIKKPQVQRALDALCDSGKITGKEFGKAKVYLPLQPDEAGLSKEVRCLRGGYPSPYYKLPSSCFIASVNSQHHGPAPAGTGGPAEKQCQGAGDAAGC